MNAQVKFWQRYKCNGKLVIYNANSEFGHSNNYNNTGYNFTKKTTTPFWGIVSDIKIITYTHTHIK